MGRCGSTAPSPRRTPSSGRRLSHMCRVAESLDFGVRRNDGWLDTGVSSWHIWMVIGDNTNPSEDWGPKGWATAQQRCRLWLLMSEVHG